MDNTEFSGKKVLILVRGLSGVGKTTVAGMLGHEMVEADMYFVDRDTGEYNFDPKKLPEAHAWCLGKTRQALVSHGKAIVSNTFTQRWEMQPYLELAEELGARVHVLDMFDGGLSNEELAARNAHGVPVEAIARMRDRYEHDWVGGDTRPPWERK
jgi:predicted kinase